MTSPATSRPPFEVFFEAEYARLARGLFLLTGDAGEADELAQEAMARAFQRWDRVAHMASPAGYVFVTAANLHRSRLRRLALKIRELAPQGPPDPATVVENRSLVRRALARMPRSQREALILVGWLEMDAEEAAQVLGTTPASVRGRVHRARNALRREMGDNVG